MFIASFPAGAWQTNCYIVAAAESGPCVIVDPGVGAAPVIADVVAERGLQPEGILLTHGHIDHMFSAHEVARAHGIGCWIHPGDRDYLTDPYSIPMARDLIAQQLGAAPDFSDREPDPLHLVHDGELLEIAGLGFRAVHAPGHTPGCTLYRLALDASEQYAEIILTGDVVFAGSIGRTDLPRGDAQVMGTTLREVVLALPDDAVLLPGHGPQTTMAQERATNPHLQL